MTTELRAQAFKSFNHWYPLFKTRYPDVSVTEWVKERFGCADLLVLSHVEIETTTAMMRDRLLEWGQYPLTERKLELVSRMTTRKLCTCISPEAESCPHCLFGCPTCGALDGATRDEECAECRLGRAEYEEER